MAINIHSRVASIGLVVSSLLALSSCGGEKSLPAVSRETPVIIISIDTLRADHLPAYGYRGVETPAIDALRDDGILYRNAYSHIPLTLPSHATMLTGRYPADIGLRDNIGFKLDEKVATLPELLKKNGFATGAAVSAFVMRSESGLGRGFDFYEDDIEANAPNQMMGRIQRDGSLTVAAAKEWMSKQNGPFFFMLHLYEPHSPYTPPEPFKSRYPNAYDGEIAHVDQLVGETLQFLRDKGIYDDSLIILVSDHGEGLGDHGEEEHGIFLYREAIHVPLIVKLPRSAKKGAEVTAPVQLADLFPTIARQTGTAFEEKTLRGKSLLSFIDAKPEHRDIYSETLYPRFHFGWSDLHSLINNDHHYIEAPRPELFELASDPQEKNNRLTELRRPYVAMRARIKPLVMRTAAPAPADPEEVSKLAALGYIGSTVSTDDDEQLPDPKDKVETAALIKKGFKAYVEKRREEAIAIFETLLRENPKMLDIWDAKARTLAELGRKQEAIEAAKTALRISPTTAHLAIMIANLSLDRGKLEEAQSHAELAVKSEPEQAHEILARIALARGDIGTAEREANLALAGKRDRAVALMTLGRIEIRRGNYQAALVRFDEAERVVKEGKKSAISMLNFNRGDALARMGREAEAEGAFREEIRLFPEGPQAYQNLILLLVAQGRTDEATKLVFDLIQSAPTPPSYVAVAETLKTIGDSRGSRFWVRKGLEKFPQDPTLRRLASG